ncbi:MAG TPA: hypothetical protein VI756_26470 [Blastocatellia bacterium]
MGKLTPGQVDEYFEMHLPYRTRILLAHYRMTGMAWSGDPGSLDACFIAALVTGRLFLNMLGIGKRGSELVRYRRELDDVMADDLGGKLLDPASLSTAEHELFLRFLVMADKAAAHFTLPMSHDWTKTHEVVLQIHHYLAVNLYEYTGRPFRDAIP